MNLAPFMDLGDAVSSADPLVVNEIEATQFLGRPIDGLAALSLDPLM